MFLFCYFYLNYFLIPRACLPRKLTKIRHFEILNSVPGGCFFSDLCLICRYSLFYSCFLKTDKAKACQLFRLVLATVTREPRSCHMECCDEDYCNTMTPLITKYSGISEASKKTAVAVEYSSAHRNSLQLINFFAIALRLCWTVLANN